MTGSRGGKGYRAMKWCGHTGAPGENRTGGHCHKIVNCSGNKRIHDYNYVESNVPFLRVWLVTM